MCDLVGSTELSARLDPEDMRDVIWAYQQCCAEIVKCWDGSIAAFIGDGVRCRFLSGSRSDISRSWLAQPQRDVCPARSSGSSTCR
jgi:class 3 adenylate cyclase